MMISKDDIDGAVNRFNMAITEEQAKEARIELLRLLSSRGGMNYYMEPEVKKIRFWKREERMKRGWDMICDEADRCIELLENEEIPDLGPIIRLLGAYEKLKDMEI